jgi:hypothetical protein
LLALGGAGIATRLDHALIFEVQGLGDDVQEGLLLAAEVEPALALAGAQRDRCHAVDDLGIDAHQIAPGRKVDPGPAFPIASFATQVMGRG